MKKLLIIIMSLVFITGCGNDEDKEKSNKPSEINMSEVIENRTSLLNTLEENGILENIKASGYELQLDEYYTKTVGDQIPPKDLWFVKFPTTYMYRENPDFNAFTVYNLSDDAKIGIVATNDENNTLSLMVTEDGGDINNPCYGNYSVGVNEFVFSECSISVENIKADLDKIVEIYFEELGRVING